MEAIREMTAAGVLSALGIVIAPYLWFPVFSSKAFPGQHMLNAISGVLLGPWWATLIALIVGTVRLSLGIGTIYAYPGGVPGALVVGLVAWLLKKIRYRHVEIAALAEPIGTVIIGGTLSVYLFAPALGHWEMAVAMLPIWGSWALSSIPGSLMGYLILQGLRKVGISWETFSRP